MKRGTKKAVLEFLETQRDLYGNELLVDRGDGALKKPLSEVKPDPKPTMIAEPSAQYDGLPSLAELQKTVSACRLCDLCKTRKQTVFGSGNSKAAILFIGEAPGADEDDQGLPFVGRAGQLLTQMIEQPRSLGIPRSEVYIANILKCRPPNNRKPLQSEIAKCEPYLIAQIENIRPRIICALGATAANTLLKNTMTIVNMRGKTFDYHGVPLIVTYHPAALLRNPEWKKPTWEDLLRLKELLGKKS